MAVDNPPVLDVNNVHDEERFFGGDIVWWLLLLLVSVPVMLWGLAQTPQIHGFLFLCVGGIAAGIAFAQIILRLPYFGNGFGRSVLIVLVASIVIAGLAFAFNETLPVPTPPLDVMYKPAVSGG